MKYHRRGMSRRDTKGLRAIRASFEGLPIAVEEHECGFNVHQDIGVVEFSTSGNAEFGATEHLLHELAHFLEIDRKRAFKENFGFSFKTKDDGPVRRELRTIAIEHRLHDAYGFKFDAAPIIATLPPSVPTRAVIAWHDYEHEYADDRFREWKRLARNFYLTCYAAFDEMWLMRRWNARMASLRQWSEECRRRKHARR